MFELSKDMSIQMEIFQDSKIYTIDNFYANPDSVVEYFLKDVPPLWKVDDSPSYNLIYFEDRRHAIKFDEITKVYKFLEFLCGQIPKDPDTIITNAIKFKKCNYNNYQNNYWFPHIDEGYNGVLYLNMNDYVSGTNLYEIINCDEEPLQGPEHSDPWRNKNNYKLVKTLIPRYNRLVLFDGLKFYHGMNICTDEYFSETYRFNQVFFFKPN